MNEELVAILSQIPAAITKALIDVLVIKHPGHGSQKVHGNRFGTGQAKESLRRLKDDKGARESYKATARKKLGVEAKPRRQSGQKSSKFSLDDIHEKTKPIGEALSATAKVNRDKTKVYFGIGRQFKSGLYSGGTVTWDIKNKRWFGPPRTVENIKFGFGIKDN